MEQKGVVVRINENKAIVLIEEGIKCHSCDFSRFCRMGEKGREIICNNKKGARIGDIVEIETNRKNLILATVLNFILPLLLLIGGILFGEFLWGSDVSGFLWGFGILILYFLIFKLVDKKILKSGSILPEVVEIVKTNSREL
ncbi:MAG: SoxR reducing system RseC family protein [candidate division WOR-3 bacterium]|nr:SoxR reducing system RseC family protein [candidate division WOR-3 bacterium]